MPELEKEYCLQCVHWRNVRWPRSLGPVICHLAMGMLTTLFGWHFLSEYRQTPEMTFSSVGNLLALSITTVMTFGFCWLISRDLFKRAHLRWHGQRPDTILFLSVDAENRLHTHRQEKRDLGSHIWAQTPCLIGQGNHGEKGHTVPRNIDSVLLEINLAYPHRSCLHGLPAKAWHVVVKAGRIEFIEKKLSESFTALLPTQAQATRQHDEDTISDLDCALNGITDSLLLINYYQSMAAIRHRALITLVQENDQALAGKINSAS